jgi:AcrR family transcriptional regulator
MDEKTAVRSPKQARSLQTKEKVIDTAYRLFCTKGYYNTNTNEIAKEAGVPIGSLYAYFKDKDTIFMEILRRYHEQFAKSNADMALKRESSQSDLKAWLSQLIESLISIHERSKEFNREIQILCYYNPEVAKLMKEQRRGSYEDTLDFFRKMADQISVTDIEAAAMVTFDSISGIVDRIAFGEYDIDRSRIINACVEEVYKYLMN